MTPAHGTASRYRLSPRLAARLGRRVCRFLLIGALSWGQPIPKISAAPASLEYGVKAAFLLNFTKFVEWPAAAFPAADAPLTICILGDDPFGRAIDQVVEGESINGHKIAVERLRSDEQKSCQVAYIGNNGTIPAAFSAAGSTVLTVGEGDDFLHEGGIVGFVIDSRHVRFDINLRSATNAGLKLSAKLLSVARSVVK